MKWFEGSIQEAVNASKKKKAIFVAFIEGKDDTSIQLSQTIESREISSRLEQDHFVAIKIESGTETYRFFVQIYQLVPVPCIYFIDAVGSPIEVVANNCQISELAAKIDDMLIKQGKNASGSSTSFIQSEQKASTVSSPVNVTTLESNSPIAPQPGISTKKEESTSELTHEEKVKRAQQLIELQKKQRIEEERKKEKERELERRKRDREVQEMRLKQRDLEIKQSHEERLKEKAEDAAARERVRQQIAQDKLLRKEKELALKKQTTQQSEKKITTPQVSNNDSSLTRIQFRLPSGGTHMGQFEPTVTLGSLRNYVSSNIEVPFQEFTLSTSFPRRDLLPEEDNKTLIELGLVPTSVILILPLKNSNSKSIITSSKDMGFLYRIMWTILSPVTGVYNYVMRYFFNPNRVSRNDEPNSQESSDVANESNSQDVPNMQQAGSLRRRNMATENTKAFKTQGNIHTLHSPRDDNDENNTWNGNSTQQM